MGHSWAISILGIIIVTIFLIILPNPVAALHDWWDVDWEFRQKVTLSNFDKTAPFVPVKITLSFDDGKVQSCENEIRVLDQTNTIEIPVNVETLQQSVGGFCTQAALKFEVNAVIGQDTIVFVYYGNSLALPFSPNYDVYWDNFNRASGPCSTDNCELSSTFPEFSWIAKEMQLGNTWQIIDNKLKWTANGGNELNCAARSQGALELNLIFNKFASVKFDLVDNNLAGTRYHAAMSFGTDSHFVNCIPLEHSESIVFFFQEGGFGERARMFFNSVTVIHDAVTTTRTGTYSHVIVGSDWTINYGEISETGTKDNVEGSYTILFNGVGDNSDSFTIDNLCVTIDATHNCTALDSDPNDVISPEEILTPQQKTQSIIDDVDGLINDGDLANDDAEELIETLNDVIKKLDKDKPEKACKNMDKFIVDTQKLIDKGKLDATDGQDLIDSANAVKDSIPC